MSRRKRSITEFLKMRSVLVAELVIALLIAWGFAGEFMRSRDMQTEIDRLQAQAESFEAHNLELADIAERYSSSSMLEREARLKLNMRRPGEEVVIVRESDVTVLESVARDGTAEVGGDSPGHKALANAKKWIRHLFSMTINP
ncbi:MAG: septum formation initiator family protein [Patescibacteria group bacterium]|nr:septum formation initiator family protein [Patescibacteria group bacterium]